MSRPIGVIVIAVFELLGSALTLLMGILMVAMVVFAPTPNQPEFPFPPTFLKAIMALVSLMYLLPAIWGIASGIGLFRSKNWARISTIVFSVLLLLMGGFSALTFLLVPIFPSRVGTGTIDPAVMSAMRFGIAVFWTGLLGIGVWWLVYLTRPKVREHFVPPVAMLAGAAPLSPVNVIQSYEAQSASVMARKPERPLSFTILAWLLLVGCLFAPLSVVLHAPAVFLTRVLTGWPATLCNMVLTAVLLYIGIGLLRLKPLARSVAVGYFVFTFINAAVFFLAPSRSGRLQYLMDQQQAMFPFFAILQKQFQPQIDYRPFIFLGACSGLIFTAIVLYFLITRKEAFEAAARAV